MAGQANFSVEKGDTFLRTITFRNKTTQVPVNIQDCTISSWIEKNGVKVTDLRSWVDDGAGGKFSINAWSNSTAENPGIPGMIPYVPPYTGTSDLAPGIYEIEVRITFLDNSIKTLIKGNFVVTD